MTNPAANPSIPADAVAPVGQIAFTLFDGSASWGKTGFIAADGSETVWIEDRLPEGAIPQASGGDRWHWVSADPAPFSGVASHQSAVAEGSHQHLFTMDDGMPLRRGSTIFLHVYLDPKNPPKQVAIQFNQNGVWEHRAWWGENKLNTTGVAAGPLPPVGKWVRLEVPAAALGLEQASKRPPRPAVPQTDGPKTLDLSQFEMTFNEDFSKPLDISPWGPGTRWIAHTPWDGDFGDARFADPEPGFPFTIVGGKLRIEARKDPSHVAKDKWKRDWAAGLLSSCDPKGNGFSQQYGYFVMRAKLPGGIGVWPAFWLVSTYDRTDKSLADTDAVELDVIEYYGRRDRYQAVVHVWQPKPHRAEGATIYTSTDFCTNAFRDYGVLVEPDFITMYTDGVAVWRTPTPAQHTRPLMLLVNFALGSGWPIDDVKSGTFMDVEYVRAYKKK